VVEEGGLRFAVNFTDYLDTGLFLDHRLTRARIRELANGKRFLNLFAYTGTASVYAAAGGAAATRTVDLSNTYLDWTRRNLELNGFSGASHVLERADCLEWVQRPILEHYDLAFVDPPTFSNSKAMDREFDVQRDHADLLRRVLDRLAPGGLLVFSTNHRRFRLDADALGGVAIEDWTAATLPRDFARRPRQRQVFALRPGQ
jgi:23S rRNA (guanine2445-N2)-methyltransferase / 23S rRNA (guanine2069-N7)-methyltransferase